MFPFVQPKVVSAVPESAEVIRTRARKAILTRHRPPEDPELAEAARDYRAAFLAEHVARVVSQGLTARQAARLRSLLGPAGTAGEMSLAVRRDEESAA